MSLKIEQATPPCYPFNSQLEAVSKQCVITTSSIQQTSDQRTVSCLDSLIDYLSSVIAKLFNLITCAFCCESKLDKLLEDPRAFLQKLMDLDPHSMDDVCVEIPLNQENTLAIHTVAHKTILSYLCKYEGDQVIAKQLGFEITSSMIQRVVSKIIKDGKGGEILHTIVREGKADLAKVLIEHGASMCAKDQAGQTPIHKIRSIEMAKIFEEKGGDFSVEDNEENTLLNLLIKEGVENHKELIKHLIEIPEFEIDEDDEAQLRLFPELKQLIESSYD